MSVIGTIYEDVTTDVLGVIGPWQWLVTFIIMLCMIFSTLNQHEDAFLLEPPLTFECLTPRTDDIVNITLCTMFTENGTGTFKCKEWRTKFLGFIWIKRSWLMFCDEEVKALSTSVISRLGSMFGCVLFGVISDCFGRRQSIKFGVIAEIVISAIMILCDSESWFHLMIFLRSLLTSANIYMGIVLICEIASNVWRTELNAIVISPRMLAIVCLMPVANLVSNSETFDFIVCVCGVFHLILLRWIPESPQWLFFNKKISDGEKLIANVAKRNGKLFGSILKIRPVDYQAYVTLDEPRTHCIGIMTIFNIRILTISILIYWCLYNFACSSLYIRVYRIKSDKYIVVQVLILVLLLAWSNICLSKKIKLRKLLVINMIIILCLETMLITVRYLNLNNTLGNLITCLALSAGVIIHALILNITPRLLAINIRATLLGMCHSAGHLGSLVCYIVMTLEVMDHMSLMVTNVAMMITLIFLCRVIPDVDGRELPDVLEDMDYFSELSKPLRWASQKMKSPSKEEIQIRIYSFNGSIYNNSTKSHSIERLPARRIGFVQGSLMSKLCNICYK